MEAGVSGDIHTQVTVAKAKDSGLKLVCVMLCHAIPVRILESFLEGGPEKSGDQHV